MIRGNDCPCPLPPTRLCLVASFKPAPVVCAGGRPARMVARLHGTSSCSIWRGPAMRELLAAGFGRVPSQAEVPVTWRVRDLDLPCWVGPREG